MIKISRANKPHIEDMKKHEIHLEFMKAALQGSYTFIANSEVLRLVKKDIEERKESAETWHARFAREAADTSLKEYLNCWPDINFDE